MAAEFFQHFKGGVYKKIADAKDCETEEELVVYQNCKTGEVWVRHARSFYEDADVVVDGESAYVPRFKPITLEEKRKLVLWRANPCEGTGRAVPEDKILRKESSLRTHDGRTAYTKGRTLCPVCDRNVSFNSREGISAHKGKK